MHGPQLSNQIPLTAPPGPLPSTLDTPTSQLTPILSTPTGRPPLEPPLQSTPTLLRIAPHGGLYCWDSSPCWGSESISSSRSGSCRGAAARLADGWGAIRRSVGVLCKGGSRGGLPVGVDRMGVS